MAATSIEVSNLLLYTSMIWWLWFLLILWTRRPSCQQHGQNHTLIPLYIPLFSRNPTSILQSLITSTYNHLSVYLPCDLYISLFSRNLTPISHFHQLPSIWKASSISHSTSCTTRSVQIIHRKPQIKYLVRWLGYGPEYDMWYSIENLQNAQELIEEYEQLHNARKNWIEQPAKAPKRRGRPPKKMTKAVAKFAGIFKRKAS